jgi:hypothetical protein
METQEPIESPEPAKKPPKPKVKRASKGYRKHVREQKAANRKTTVPRN